MLSQVGEHGLGDDCVAPTPPGAPPDGDVPPVCWRTREMHPLHLFHTWEEHRQPGTLAGLWALRGDDRLWKLVCGYSFRVHTLNWGFTFNQVLTCTTQPPLKESIGKSHRIL